MNNDLAVVSQDIYACRDAFLAVQAEPSLNFDREANFAIQILEGNSYTLKVALQNRQAVIDAVTNIASIGLSLNPAKKQAYFVPRKGKICLDISYNRLQSLAAGAQFFFWARLVDRTGNIGPFYPVKNGVMGQASAEAGPILEMIAGQIGETELGKELLDRIELIDGDGSGSVNDRLNEAKKELEGLIGEITDALEYDNAKAYASGEVVRLGNRLFQAIAATTGHSPPDATYWLDMGTLAETTNALVLQVQKNSASIIEQDGKITAQAEQLTSA